MVITNVLDYSYSCNVTYNCAEEKNNEKTDGLSQIFTFCTNKDLRISAAYLD